MQNNILSIRKYIFQITKILGISICIYFIYYAKTYTVLWNVTPSWFFPTWIISLNSMLSTAGTYILVIPLTVIISSFIIEYKPLNVMACLFSVSGGLVSIIINLTNGTFKEFTNFKIFVVHHTLNLEAKRELFIKEYKLVAISLCENIQNKLDYVIAQLNDINFVLYNNDLTRLPAIEIKAYAYRIVTEHISVFEHSQPSLIKRSLIYMYSGLTIHNIMITVGILAVCVGGYKFISWLITDNHALQGATLQKEAADIAAETTNIETEQIGAIAQLINICKDMVQHGFKMLMQISTQNSEKISLLEKSVIQLTKDSDFSKHIVAQLMEDFNNFKDFITNLPKDE